MYHILICDDDADIATTLSMYLAAEGYQVTTARDGQEAIDLLGQNDFHLILMDVMMPRLDGIRATALVRKISNIPILMLTAKSEDSDMVLGLNSGADDYITKPFHPVEVMARVRAQLRRYATLGGMPVAVEGVRTVGGITLDDREKRVTLDGEPVSLTPREYQILKLLMDNPNRVYASKELYAAVWGQSPMGTEGSVAVHIRHLREKLEIDPSQPRYIKVLWGQGYKLETKVTI